MVQLADYHHSIWRRVVFYSKVERGAVDLVRALVIDNTILTYHFRCIFFGLGVLLWQQIVTTIPSSWFGGRME